jgi:DNA-binding transcriptional LysR family regulator
MENFDYLDIDGRQLKLLLTIEEAGSLSRAGKILDLNQSTVSYWLDMLRKRLGDPLFVRAGNGVEPTERARKIFPIAREALVQLESIGNTDLYDHAKDFGSLSIAASSVERDTIIKPFLHKAITLAPHLKFKILNSGSADYACENLRMGKVDFTILPNKWIEGECFSQHLILRFNVAVFFDPLFPHEEGDLDDYCKRPHVQVVLGDEAGFFVDRYLKTRQKSRHVAVQVGDFNSALELVKGTPLLATLPSHLAQFSGRGLQHVQPPWPNPEQQLMLYWHSRQHYSAKHHFWRERLLDITKGEV